jgi:hypothetical protein
MGIRTPVSLEAQMVCRSVETPDDAPAVRKMSSGSAGWPSRSKESS